MFVLEQSIQSGLNTEKNNFIDGNREHNDKSIGAMMNIQL